MSRCGLGTQPCDRPTGLRHVVTGVSSCTAVITEAKISGSHDGKTTWKADKGKTYKGKSYKDGSVTAVRQTQGASDPYYRTQGAPYIFFLSSCIGPMNVRPARSMCHMATCRHDCPCACDAIRARCVAHMTQDTVRDTFRTVNKVYRDRHSSCCDQPTSPSLLGGRWSVRGSLVSRSQESV